MRKEWYLVSIAFVVFAVLLLYQVREMTDYEVLSVPQTAVQSTVQTEATEKSRYAVNVNEASYEELMGVKGMNETMARGILEYRAETGRFYSLDDLLKVSGFGKVTLEKVRPYLCTE